MAEVIATQFRKSLSFIHHDNCESRGISVESMIRQTVDKYRITKDFRFRVWTGDVPNGPYSFSTTNEDWKSTFPCFLFDSWPECGVIDYEKTVSSFINTEPETIKVGWIGASGSIIPRNIFIKNFGNTKNSEAMINDWNRQDPNHLWKNTKSYMSYQDQVDRWKYLIDMEGVGWSARLKILMHSPRNVFIVDRPYKEYFYQYLQPWVTHIPVKRDLSDLVDNYRRIESDPELQKTMLENKKEFCKKYLSKDAVYSRINDIITSL